MKIIENWLWHSVVDGLIFKYIAVNIKEFFKMKHSVLLIVTYKVQPRPGS